MLVFFFREIIIDRFSHKMAKILYELPLSADSCECNNALEKT
jgi:hypothetical protein